MDNQDTITIEGNLEALVEEIETGQALQHWVALAANKEKVLNRMEEIYRHSWPATPTVYVDDGRDPDEGRWSTFKEKLRDQCIRVGWIPRKRNATQRKMEDSLTSP